MVMVECESCGGDGEVIDDEGDDMNCPECHGEGIVEVDDD